MILRQLTGVTRPDFLIVRILAFWQWVDQRQCSAELFIVWQHCHQQMLLASLNHESRTAEDCAFDDAMNRDLLGLGLAWCSQLTRMLPLQLLQQNESQDASEGFLCLAFQ